MNVCIISNPGVLGGEVDSDDMEGKSIREKASIPKGPFALMEWENVMCRGAQKDNYHMMSHTCTIYKS